MTRIAAMISLCLFSTVGTSMLLGCSGDDGGTESVKQTGTGGHAGAKAPFYGLAGGGTSSAGATSSAGSAGVGGAAGGAIAGGAGTGGTAAAAGFPSFAGAPQAGRDSFGFGGASGSGTVIRTDRGGAGGFGGADFDLGGDDRDEGPSFSFGGLGGTSFWFSG
jgi:hypothetical protein